MKTNVKNICLIFILLAIAGGIHAKNMHKVFGTDEKIIRSAAKIDLYMVDVIPVMSPDQIQGENYIYDYRVMKAMSIKKKAGSALIKAVLDTNQYMNGVAKKCPFMGKYAVQFRQGKRSITIILSTNPCEKAIVFCPGSIIDKKHIDIIENSTIITAIDLLFNPVVITEGKK